MPPQRLATLVQPDRFLERDFAAYNQAYAELMPEPHPARKTVGSDLIMGMLVEIDMVAAVRE